MWQEWPFWRPLKLLILGKSSTLCSFEICILRFTRKWAYAFWPLNRLRKIPRILLILKEYEHNCFSNCFSRQNSLYLNIVIDALIASSLLILCVSSPLLLRVAFFYETVLYQYFCPLYHSEYQSYAIYSWHRNSYPNTFWIFSYHTAIFLFY